MSEGVVPPIRFHPTGPFLELRQERIAVDHSSHSAHSPTSAAFAFGGSTIDAVVAAAADAAARSRTKVRLSANASSMSCIEDARCTAHARRRGIRSIVPAVRRLPLHLYLSSFAPGLMQHMLTDHGYGCATSHQLIRPAGFACAGSGVRRRKTLIPITPFTMHNQEVLDCDA